MARALGGNGNSSDDGGMDARFDRIEQRLTAVERNVATLKEDVAVIRSNYVTIEDLYKAIDKQTWRLVTFVCGFGTALVAATYFVVTQIK